MPSPSSCTHDSASSQHSLLVVHQETPWKHAGYVFCSLFVQDTRVRQKQTGRHGKASTVPALGGLCTQVQNHTPTKSQLTETNKKMTLHPVEPSFAKLAAFRQSEDMRKKNRANHTQCCKFEHWQNNFTISFPLHFHMCSIRRYVLRVHWLFVHCHCGDKKPVLLASWPSLRGLVTYRGQ